MARGRQTRCTSVLQAYPDDFWLHKFRATFATWALWGGVDLRTVQLWMGHSDMESTTLEKLRATRVHVVGGVRRDSFRVKNDGDSVQYGCNANGGHDLLFAETLFPQQLIV